MTQRQHDRRARRYPRVNPVGTYFPRANLLDQLETVTREGLLVAPQSVQAIGAAGARRNRWIVAGLWVIAGLLAIMLFW